MTFLQGKLEQFISIGCFMQVGLKRGHLMFKNWDLDLLRRRHVDLLWFLFGPFWGSRERRGRRWGFRNRRLVGRVVKRIRVRYMG